MPKKKILTLALTLMSLSAMSSCVGDAQSVTRNDVRCYAYDEEPFLFELVPLPIHVVLNAAELEKISARYGGDWEGTNSYRMQLCRNDVAADYMLSLKPITFRNVLMQPNFFIAVDEDGRVECVENYFAY